MRVKVEGRVVMTEESGRHVGKFPISLEVETAEALDDLFGRGALIPDNNGSVSMPCVPMAPLTLTVPADMVCELLGEQLVEDIGSVL